MGLKIKRFKEISSIILLISIIFTSLLSLSGIIKNHYINNIESSVYNVLKVNRTSNTMLSNTYLYSLVIESSSIKSIYSELNKYENAVSKDSFNLLLKSIKQITDDSIKSNSFLSKTVGKDYLYLLSVVSYYPSADELNNAITNVSKKNTYLLDVFSTMCNVIVFFIISTLILGVLDSRQEKRCVSNVNEK